LCEEAIGFTWLLVFRPFVSSHGPAISRLELPLSFGRIRDYMGSLNLPTEEGTDDVDVQETEQMRVFRPHRSVQNAVVFAKIREATHFFDLPNSVTRPPHLSVAYAFPNSVTATFLHSPPRFLAQLLVLSENSSPHSPDTFENMSAYGTLAQNLLAWGLPVAQPEVEQIDVDISFIWTNIEKLLFSPNGQCRARRHCRDHREARPGFHFVSEAGNDGGTRRRTAVRGTYANVPPRQDLAAPPP
jgi:hypothetical protein